MTKRLLVLFCAVPLALALAGSAAASQLLDRNATGVKLAVNRKGQALITYHAHGRLWHVLMWGAINARNPNPNVPQVQFRYDRSGGWASQGHAVWQNFANACTRYDGPSLPFLVAACKAPDGSYWALQSWQRMYPDLGFLPWTSEQSAWELHVSHWTGPLAKLEVYSNWVWGDRYHQLFGRLTYHGAPVYGFKTNRYGARLDKYGRLIYIDTYDSVYGKGWRRENSFVTHNPTGVWCYGFYQWDPSKGGYGAPPSWPHGKLRGPGIGTQYRVITEGPGVTPDIDVIVPGLHDFQRGNAADAALQSQMDALLNSWGDKACHSH